MVLDFAPFGNTVRQRVAELTKDGQQVFRAGVSGDVLWDTYLKSFPEGTNPMFRQRTEHDCACCRSFIKGVGNLVALSPTGDVQTIWDTPLEGPYGVVSAALAALVRGSKIQAPFLSTEPSFGKVYTYETTESGSTIKWDHFSCTLPAHLVTKDIGERISKAQSAYQVLNRGLQEFTGDHFDVVLDLIRSQSIYRGEEHLPAIEGFQALKAQWDALSPERWDAFVWLNVSHPAAWFRNTAIGTLFVDLAEGLDLDKAIGRFEAKVAPANYKRSSAPITKGMIEKALVTLRELNLEGAIRRRHARISDISPADVLFVDRSSRAAMKDPLADLLMKEVTVKKKAAPTAADTISAEDFFQNILPGAEAIQLLVEPKHAGNFMSLTAPEEPDSGRLFQWDNGFAWCYAGNVTDTDMRKAVQAKGGRVDGAFRFTHSWNHPGQRNASLMDLHVFMPGSSQGRKDKIHDIYGNDERVGWNHRNHYRSGGVQDVDYTDEAPAGHIPVENITFPSIDKMPEGRYVCRIHNWKARSPNQGGFKAEIEFAGHVYQYSYDKPLVNKEWVTVAEVTLNKGVFTIEHHLLPTHSNVEVWGIKSNQYVSVSAVTLSPNYWGDKGRGNKHYLFLLEGCKNPEPIRGFFNEFLRPDLILHRKVFEVLASKTLCPPTDDQLSGVGFSSTRHDSATFSVRKGGATRNYHVQF